MDWCEGKSAAMTKQFGLRSRGAGKFADFRVTDRPLVEKR
jgi:hypothetical protein